MFLLIVLFAIVPLFTCVPSDGSSNGPHEERLSEAVPQKADVSLEEKDFQSDLKDKDGSDDDSIDQFNGTHYLDSHNERYGNFHTYDLLYRDIPNGNNSKNVGIDADLLAEYVGQDIEGSNEDAPLFVASMDDVVNKLKMWHKLIPRVHPFYAIKCNDDANVAKVLAALGAGFDCASIVSKLNCDTFDNNL